VRTNTQQNFTENAAKNQYDQQGRKHGDWVEYKNNIKAAE